MSKLTKLEQLKIQEAAKIMKNPVLWAKTFLRTVNNSTKKVEPWTARWYQAEMLLDQSEKKVARCGRRTGGQVLPFSDKLRGYRMETHRGIRSSWTIGLFVLEFRD